MPWCYFKSGDGAEQQLHVAFIVRAVVAWLVPGCWLAIPALLDAHVRDVGCDFHERMEQREIADHGLAPQAMTLDHLHNVLHPLPRGNLLRVRGGGVVYGHAHL